MVENRAAMAKACSWLFYDHPVQPTEQYGRMLRNAGVPARYVSGCLFAADETAPEANPDQTSRN